MNENRSFLRNGVRMKRLQQIASSSVAPAFVYSIKPSGTAVASISSDDSLRLFDRATLVELADGHIQLVNRGVKCLDLCTEDVLATAGDDCHVRCWDTKSKKQTSDFKCASTRISLIAPRADVGLGAVADADFTPITSLCCHPSSNILVEGTEYVQQQSAVIIWFVYPPQ